MSIIIKAKIVGPLVRVKTLSNQSFSPGGYAIPFDTQDYGSTGMWSSSAPTKIVIPKAGIYDIKAAAYITGPGITKAISVRLNGTTFIGSSLRPGDGVTNQISNELAVDYKLNKGDFIELVAFGDTAGVLNFGSDYSVVFTARWAGKIPG